VSTHSGSTSVLSVISLVPVVVFVMTKAMPSTGVHLGRGIISSEATSRVRAEDPGDGRKAV